MSDNAGYIYEKEVTKIVKKAFRPLKGLNVKSDDHSNPFSSSGADLSVRIKGKEYGFEIKHSSRSLLGSNGYNYVSGKFVPVKSAKVENSLDQDTKELVEQTLKEKSEDKLLNIMKYFRGYEPVFFNGLIEKLPMNVTADAWKTAQAKGMLVPLNNNVRYDARFVRNLYSSKGISYIQIGGRGLFYLDNNPLEFDIPKFDGEINLETRLKASGQKRLTSLDEPYITANINVAARMVAHNKQVSKFTIDNPDHILMLFGKFV